MLAVNTAAGWVLQVIRYRELEDMENIIDSGSWGMYFKVQVGLVVAWRNIGPSISMTESCIGTRGGRGNAGRQITAITLA